MVIYYILEIFLRMFACVDIGYISDIIILFSAFMLIIAHFLGIPFGLYFYMTKIGKLKGIALVIYSSQFCL